MVSHPTYKLPMLQHDGRRSMLIGCTVCKTFDVCGGLNVAAPGLFNCRRLCSCDGADDDCNAVCPKHPVRFVNHLQEVGGFGFEDLPPSTAACPAASLPDSVPLIYGSSRRFRPLRVSAFAVPLAALFDRRAGKCRFDSGEDLCRSFGVVLTAQVIVSGVDVDRVLERYWSVARGADFVRSLAALKPALVTVPNFSLFCDVPREDNLHNMKRIAICWHELAAAGIPAALHVNARTDHDWLRWAEFLKAHPEISAVAFEFATGARPTGRGLWHVRQLELLRDRVGRDLTLVLRGEQFIRRLRGSYAHVVALDTTVYVKTMKRFRQVRTPAGERAWRKSYTLIGQPVDDLLQANVDVGQGI